MTKNHPDMKPIITCLLIFSAIFCRGYIFAQTTFTNNNAITTYDNGPGNPFPSTIAVSGLNSYTTKVVVTLHGVNIPNIVCNQVYVQSPTGQIVCLFSRSGPAFYNAVGEYVFDQLSSAQPPEVYGANFPAGTYRPYIANAQALPANTTSRLDSFNNHNPNGTWSLYENGVIAYNGVGSIAGWSLTITSTNVPLSLSLISFDVRKQGKEAELLWKTAEELNTGFFGVERSTDGKVFNQIGEIKAEGHAIEVSTYSYTDEEPATANNFYRLRMVDQDGTYRYSPIAAADFSSGRISKLYPNPCKDKLILDLSQLTHISQITIVNIEGINVLSQSISPKKGGQVLDVSVLVPGIYFAKIDGQIYRFQKQ